VNALELPPAALDVLIDELGGKKAVAEMTGRKSRMVRSADGRRFVLEARAKPESSEMENLNVSERNAFMDGKKLIAIISDAASTGISLQVRRDLDRDLTEMGPRICPRWSRLESSISLYLARSRSISLGSRPPGGQARRQPAPALPRHARAPVVRR
jgi:hypothetical protein